MVWPNVIRRSKYMSYHSESIISGVGKGYFGVPRGLTVGTRSPLPTVLSLAEARNLQQRIWHMTISRRFVQGFLGEPGPDCKI